MKWPEMFRNGSAAKSIAVGTLPPDARNELERTKHDDVDELVELRPAGELRIFGVRHEDVLSLIWWDPHHRFFPPKKR
jgi:hypothetical protein